MTFRTRAKYSAIRKKYEGSLDALVVLAAVATLPIVVAQARGDGTLWVVAGDWLIWAVFVLDYLFMVLTVEERWAYTRRNWLKVLIIVLSFPLMPELLALVRMARLARLVRLSRVITVTTRGLHATKSSLAGKSLMYVASTTGLLVITGASLLLILEPATVHEDFWGSVWWAMVTVTTVGYGDIAPATLPGRLAAVVLMLSGLGLISTLAASISAYFIGSERETEFQAVTERLERIEDMLKDIKARE
jgi:voltage-gated potassium channel